MAELCIPPRLPTPDPPSLLGVPFHVFCCVMLCSQDLEEWEGMDEEEREEAEEAGQGHPLAPFQTMLQVRRVLRGIGVVAWKALATSCMQLCFACSSAL